MKVGITGHQNIGPVETIEWVSNVLNTIIHKCGISNGYTSLAIGADQLYAELLRNNNIPYTAVVPSDGYEALFKFDDQKRYLDLLQSARTVIKLNYDKPSEIAFYRAGRCVVDYSDVVIAIWNGLEAKGLGGTGDIVEYAVSKGKKIIHINPLTRSVTVLDTGRK